MPKLQTVVVYVVLVEKNTDEIDTHTVHYTGSTVVVIM